MDPTNMSSTNLEDALKLAFGDALKSKNYDELINALKKISYEPIKKIVKKMEHALSLGISKPDIYKAVMKSDDGKTLDELIKRKEKSNNMMWIILLIVLIVVVLVAVGGFFLYKRSQNNNSLTNAYYY